MKRTSMHPIHRLSLSLGLGLALVLAALGFVGRLQPAAAQPIASAGPVVQPARDSQAPPNSAAAPRLAALSQLANLEAATPLPLAERSATRPALVPLAAAGASCDVRFTQVTSTSGTVKNEAPSISADAARIAFVSDRSGNDEIFLFERPDSLQQLTNKSSTVSGSPSINADGTRVAFHSTADLSGSNPDDNYEIFLYDSTAAITLTQVTDTSGDIFHIVDNLYPSSDAAGSFIAFISDHDLVPLVGNADSNPEIFLYDTTTMLFTQVTSTSLVNNSAPALSGDGSRLAFVSQADLTGQNGDNNSEIFLYDTTTMTFTQVTTTTGGVVNDAPALSDDGSRLVYVSDSQIFMAEIDSGGKVLNPTQITSSGLNKEPAISGDGNIVAYVGDGDIYRYEVASTSAVSLTNTGNNAAPDTNEIGSHIAFVSSADHDPDGDNADGNQEIFFSECPVSDLTLTKTTSVATIGLEEVFTYTVIIENQGPSDIDASSAYTMTDQLPAGVGFIRASSDEGDCDEAGGTITCSLTATPLPFPDQATTTVTIVVTGPASPGTIVNTARITYTVDDPNQENDTTTLSTIVRPKADLQVTKTVVPTPTVAKGGVLTYTLAITNLGPNDTSNITLADELPADLTVSEVDPDGTCDELVQLDHTLNCTIDVLPNGTSLDVKVVGTAPDASGVQLVNTATVTHTGQVGVGVDDPNLDNNTSDPVTTFVGVVDLQLGKTASADIIPAGNLLVYTLTLTNTSDSPAANVVLTDTVVPATVNVGALYDNFDDDWLDPTLWSTNLNIPAGGASVIETGGRVELRNRGHLLTQKDFEPTTATPVRITGRWTFDNPLGDYDLLQILTRSDGEPYWYYYGETQFGIEFVIDENTNNLRIVRRWYGSPTTLASSGTVPGYVEPGDVYDFEIIDDGLNLSFSVTKIESPLCCGGVGQVTTVIAQDSVLFPIFTNRVVFHNREYMSWWPYDNLSYLDDVRIFYNGNEVQIDSDLVNSCPFDTGTMTFTCTIGDLPAGTHTFAFFASPTEEGQVLNTAGVSTSDLDPNKENNKATATTTVQAVADLLVLKSASPVTAVLNSTLTYHITATNLGPSTVPTVTLADTLPDDVTYNSPVSFTPGPGTCSHSSGSTEGGQVDCTFYDMAPNASQFVTINVTPNANPPSGLLTNTVTVDSPITDSVELNNTAVVTTYVNPVDLVITKTAVATVDPGSPLQYRLTITNNGQYQANTVKITDTVQGAVESGYSITLPPGCTDQGGLVVSCSSLPAGDTIILTITVTAGTVGIIKNTAEVSSLEFDLDSTNNKVGPVVTLVGPVDLWVSKVPSDDPATVGQPLTYDITITNTGTPPAVATQVRLTDTLTNTAGISTFVYESLLGDKIILEDYFSSGSINPDIWQITEPFTDSEVTVPSGQQRVRLRDRGYLYTKDTYDPVEEGGLTITGKWVFKGSGPKEGQNDILQILTRSDAEPDLSQEGETQNGIEFYASEEDDQMAILVRVSGSSVITLAETSVTLTTGTPYNFTITDDGQDLSFTLAGNPPIIATGVLTHSGPGFVVFHNRYNPATNKEYISFLDDVKIERGSFCELNGLTLICSYGSLSPTHSVTATIIATPTKAGIMTNTVTVGSLEPDMSLLRDVDDYPNEQVVVTYVDPADLLVGKEVSLGFGEALVGQPLTYTVVITNDGPSNASVVTLTDKLSGISVDIISATMTGGSCSDSDSTIICTVNDLDDGDPAVVATIVVEPTESGSLTNTATVASTQPDPNQPNTASVTVEVKPTADLSVGKSAQPFTPLVAGSGRLTYTLRITNEGPSAANVTLTDTLPSQEVRFIEADAISGQCTEKPDVNEVVISGQVVCTFDDPIDEGQNRVVEIVVEPLDGGTLTNVVTVTGDVRDIDLENNTDSVSTEVIPRIDLEITKSASRAEALWNNPLTYTLTIINHGPSTAQNVQITDTLVVTPLGGINFGPVSPGSCTAWTDNSFTCNLGPLSRTATITVTAVVIPNGPTGTITNTATVTSGETNLDSYPTTATITNPIRPAAELVVTKSGPSQVASADGSFNFQITVTNQGPAATTVTLTDTLVDGTITGDATKGSASPSPQGLCDDLWTGDSFTCDLGNIISGATVTVDVPIDPHSSGTLLNTARATGAQLDPNENNNEDSAQTLVDPVDLAIAKFASDDPVTEGVPFTYTLVVTNNGDRVAQGVVLTDDLPSNVTLDSEGSVNFGQALLMHMNETSGAIIDSSGNGRDGTNNGATGATGKFGTSALSFDGVDNYVQVPSFTLGGAVTVAAWVYSRDVNANWARIIDFGNGPDNNNIFLGWEGTSGKMTWSVFQGSTGSAVTTDEVFPQGQWVHVVAVNDGNGNGYIYWDGILKKSGSQLAPFAISRSNQYIARSNWAADAYFNGLIDELVIYDRALSAAEIATLANSTAELNSCTGTDPVTCNLADIASGATSQVTIVVVPEAGSLVNTARVASIQPELTPLDNETVITTTAIESNRADLAVTKDVTPNVAKVGKPLTYTISINNLPCDGCVSASGIVLTDTLPGGVTFSSVTPDSSCSPSGGTVICDFGSTELAVGESWPVTIVVLPTVEGVIVNTVTVTPTNNVDDKPHNNTAYASTSGGGVYLPIVLKNAVGSSSLGVTGSEALTTTAEGDRPATIYLPVLLKSAGSAEPGH